METGNDNLDSVFRILLVSNNMNCEKSFFLCCSEVDPILTVESDQPFVPTWQATSGKRLEGTRLFVVVSNYSKTQYSQRVDPYDCVTQFHTCQHRNKTTGTLRTLETC